MIHVPRGIAAIAVVRIASCVLGLLALSRVAVAQGPLSVLAAFGAPGPQHPQAALIQGTDGNFYGTTLAGGAFNLGTVFRLTPAGDLTELYAFTGGEDGAAPTANVILGADGNFYGTTSQGGIATVGTVFRVTPAGALTVLHGFTGGPDGGAPAAGLLQGSDGNFYGTTLQGGDANSGVAFRLSPAGALTVLHSFTGASDGAYPYAGLIRGTSGDFYGTTSQGGDFGGGTVFELSPTGLLTTLYAFTGGLDGAYPYAGLVQGTDGNFYGTTSQGGAGAVGTVFELTPAGAFTTLYGFTGGADGGYPYGGLIQGTDGNFYGTAIFGGAANAGTVFQWGSGGPFTVVFTFTGGTDGAYPAASLMQAADGNFYGTAYAGGDLGAGTAFRIKGGKSPTITWAPPAPIAFGTRLSAAQLNATANVPGTFTYVPPAGTLLHAGDRTLTLTFTPADASYATLTRNLTLTVVPLTPVVTWSAPASIPYGTPLGATQLNARSRTAGTFLYDPPAGSVLPVGTNVLSVTFVPTNSVDYTVVAQSVSLTVTVATPVISWTPVAMAFGTALTVTQLNATANTAGTFAYAPGLGTVLGVGPQTLSVTFTPADPTSFTTATATAIVNVATPGVSGGGNKYPLQFTPASGARSLVVAGYQLVPDSALGYTVVGNCSYIRVTSGSGRDPRSFTTYYNQTCTWDPYGKLLAIAQGAPIVPKPISVVGTQTIYAANGTGAYTGSDSSLPGGFVFTPGSHYTWLTSNAYKVLPQALYTFTATLKSDGNMPLAVASVSATTANVNGAVTVTSTTCRGPIPVGSTCAVTVTYDPSRFRSPTGLAYDTLNIRVAADAGQVRDFAQSYTIVLTPANTQD